MSAALAFNAYATAGKARIAMLSTRDKLSLAMSALRTPEAPDLQDLLARLRAAAESRPPADSARRARVYATHKRNADSCDGSSTVRLGSLAD